MASLKRSAEIIVTKCLGIKPSEKCLIIYDKNKEKIAKTIYSESKKVCNKTDLIEIPVGKVNGEEPPKNVAKKMREYDVIICPTTKSLTHTDARIAASDNARIATLPNITEDVLKRCIDVDYDEMSVLTNKVADIFDKAKIIKVTTKLGTDITFNVAGNVCEGRNVGIIREAGQYTNLPEAECYLAPNHVGTDGVYVVDASQAGIGLLDSPIKITVKNGFAVKVEGGKQAKDFKKLLDSINDKNAFNVAEFGFGTNKKAKVTGIILEDEKVFGTCHVALGKNDSFGGDINVPIHVDGVIRKPTIIVDGSVIMKDGKMTV